MFTLIKQLKQKLDNKDPVKTVSIGEVYEQLTYQIKHIESVQMGKYQQIQKRLEQRETELDSVKNLFVEKLRELESNFAEIGDHIMAN